MHRRQILFDVQYLCNTECRFKHPSRVSLCVCHSSSANTYPYTVGELEECALVHKSAEEWAGQLNGVLGRIRIAYVTELLGHPPA
jgi:hypothetical protein